MAVALVAREKIFQSSGGVLKLAMLWHGKALQAPISAVQDLVA